jgi:hypothetical protein
VTRRVAGTGRGRAGRPSRALHPPTRTFKRGIGSQPERNAHDRSVAWQYRLALPLCAIRDSPRLRAVGIGRAWPQVGVGGGREVDVQRRFVHTAPSYRGLATPEAGHRRPHDKVDRGGPPPVASTNRLEQGCPGNRPDQCRCVLPASPGVWASVDVWWTSSARPLCLSTDRKSVRRLGQLPSVAQIPPFTAALQSWAGYRVHARNRKRRGTRRGAGHVAARARRCRDSRQGS